MRDVFRSEWKGASAPQPVVNSYDPQIGAAAQTEANLGKQELDWTQNYYDQYVTPALQHEQTLADQSIALQQQDEARQQALSDAAMAAAQHQQAQQDQVFGLQFGEAQKAADEYNNYGLPAETNFYNAVNSYSAPQYQEQQAEAALGDQRTAEQVAQQNQQRQMAAAGINRASPAAVAAMSDQAVQNAAAEAAASTRARTAAQQLGIQLKQSAASMAAGGAATALGFGQGATGAGAAGAAGNANLGGVASGANSSAGAMAGSSAGIGLGSFGATTQAAGVPLAGYAGAQGANGNVLNAWAGLGSTNMSQNGANERAYLDYQAKESAGIGQFVGQALGMGAKFAGKAFGLPF